MRGQVVWLAAVAALILYVGELCTAKGDDLAVGPAASGVPADANTASGGPAPANAPAAIFAPVPLDSAPPLLDGSKSNAGSDFDARFGAFYHGFGSVEKNTYDINASLLSPRLNFDLPGYLAYALPRFQIGGAKNVDGRTSFAYAGVAWDLPITRWLFVEPYIGGAIHSGRLAPTFTFAGLGCPLLFHAGTTLGFVITEHWTALATFEHLSNGRGIFGIDCGTNEIPGGNQGLNNVGVSLDYAF